jgi:O-methyltransferase
MTKIKLFTIWLLGTFLNWNYKFIEGAVLKYYDPEVKTVLKHAGLRMKLSEYLMVYHLAQSQVSVKGDYVELGIFHGDSAALICEAKGNKVLHCIDTFEGLPEVQKIDSRVYNKGMYRASVEQVTKRLSKFRNVKIYKGLFSEKSFLIKDKVFSFVHLDCDIYESMKQAIDFFSPRLNDMGVILIHDYHMDGIKRAVYECRRNYPNMVLTRLPYTQLLIRRGAKTLNAAADKKLSR